MRIIILSIAVILLWGMWAFLFKVGVSSIGIKEALVWNNIVAIMISIAVILYLMKDFEFEPSKGAFYVMIATIFGITGSIIWYFALEKYKASIIVPFTALYPLITVTLSIIFLREKISTQNLIGIFLAIAAGILLSI